MPTGAPGVRDGAHRLVERSRIEQGAREEAAREAGAAWPRWPDVIQRESDAGVIEGESPRGKVAKIRVRMEGWLAAKARHYKRRAIPVGVAIVFVVRYGAHGAVGCAILADCKIGAVLSDARLASRTKVELLWNVCRSTNDNDGSVDRGQQEDRGSWHAHSARILD